MRNENDGRDVNLVAALKSHPEFLRAGLTDAHVHEQRRGDEEACLGHLHVVHLPQKRGGGAR